MKTGRPITSTASAGIAPFRLKRIMRDAGLQQSDLRQAITVEIGRTAGQPISSCALSVLLTQRRWPGNVRPDAIREQVTAWLVEQGVAKKTAARAWDIDGTDADVPAPAATNPDTFELPEAEMLSQAAREQFGFARHPFVDDVQGPQDVYLSADQRYIRESMYYAAKHGGFVAVIGESGSGKTTLRRDLVERIRRDNEPIVIIQPQTIDKKVLTAAHICDAIVADLSTETPKLSLEAKARQVQRVLASSARTGVSHVLVIEEAHDLSVATLKYLKRFWELEDGFKKLLGIILIGQPELGDRLDERRNYDAREVIRRCEVARLKPLNGNLEEYLRLKLKRVGVAPETIFERDAFDAIRARLTRRRPGTTDVESQLYPLIVQNLIVKCLNQCAELGLPKISAQQVEGV